MNTKENRRLTLFLRLELQNFFLDGVLDDESFRDHRLGLPDPMRALDGLLLRSRIPPWKTGVFEQTTCVFLTTRSSIFQPRELHPHTAMQRGLALLGSVVIPGHP